MKRGIEFWVQVMRMGDDRLLKEVMLQALELKGKVHEVGKRFAAEFGEVWVERAGCGGFEWTDSEGRETVESKRRLYGGKK